MGYIETQHAISEANRVFDFDGWSYTIEEMALVQNEQKAKRKKNEDDKDVILNYIGYTSKVRVVVDNVVREGVGFGQGIDADVGKAHESAIKEAESDALKRALRSFGNIFGLALYDKSGENITSGDDENFKNITKQQAVELATFAKEMNFEIERILKIFNVDGLLKLTVKQWAGAKKIIQDEVGV